MSCLNLDLRKSNKTNGPTEAFKINAAQPKLALRKIDILA